MEWIGIDYGSKLAGTTVVCFPDGKGNLSFLNSNKKQDADKMIEDFLNNHQPNQVFIDAPLSLPNAYFGKGDDFFYREGDKEIGAMSPMFLGGLTARAMKLKSKFKDSEVSFFEAYPGGLAKKWNFKELNYKKEKEAISKVVESITLKVPFSLNQKPTNWHEVDALLAFAIGYRYYQNEAKFFGEEKEGGIWV